ncbi:hypothetical protein K8942_01710 [Candidatus Peribacteria bacterium]|nr:MAG: hypothetical protein K8942_01710 [Candidatus Peribacteria bacterium]
MQIAVFSRDDADNHDSVEKITADLRVIHPEIGNRLLSTSTLLGNKLRIVFYILQAGETEVTHDSVELANLTLPLGEDIDVGMYIMEPVWTEIALRTRSRLRRYL